MEDYSESVGTREVTLSGEFVRLDPLAFRHADGLAAAASGDPAVCEQLYRWTPVPRTRAEAERYIEIAVEWRANGSAVPFAIARRDGTVIGSTRFWNFEQWNWPEGHPEKGARVYEACEIGHTWLAASAIRTAANTEAKLLMMTHAFETWRVRRVCLHTDARNARSRAAIERIGAKFEGILRVHRLGADLKPRDSARYSILQAEWPATKEKLEMALAGNGRK